MGNSIIKLSGRNFIYKEKVNAREDNISQTKFKAPYTLSNDLYTLSNSTKPA